MCLQPEDRVTITVTWTPVEEGGVRELLSFTANGIVKHQAILLGKAEGAKTKKVNLFFIVDYKMPCFPAQFYKNRNAAQFGVFSCFTRRPANFYTFCFALNIGVLL